MLLTDQLRPGTSYALFLQGAEPKWENAWNQGGGRLMCVTNRLGTVFEHIVMLLVGDTLDDLVRAQPTPAPSSHSSKSGQWARKDEVTVTHGTVVGVVANKRREGGDRIELWLSGKPTGSKLDSRWVDKLIFSVFKTLTDQQVTVELKNDLSIVGTLKSVDQFLNIKLENIRVVDEERHPHMIAVRSVFIRGSVVRFVQIPKAAVDTQLLEDATRRENANAHKGAR
ncbi:U6 snRNA-associated Sm-like protein LSm2 [Microbotryomycetes sp. JL201]|nr:U6 snRNA-associated Sm-like protein LSm2 [Microbotryomycetes sp. JL201]